MNPILRFAPAILALASLSLAPSARADDKKKDYAKKLYQWQQEQQQLQQQWKMQEVQRQREFLQHKQAMIRKRALLAPPGSPWGVNQNGRGAMTFTGGVPHRLNFAVVTLDNFFDANGNPRNSGPVTITFYGDYAFPWRGTWSMQGNLTVGLSLTPDANAGRGDRALGNLTMTPPNGQRLSRITLTGVLSGNPFTTTFAAQ